MSIGRILILSCLTLQAWAQTPTVPSRMEFAGIKLRIQESGRKDIQEDVDLITRSRSHYEKMSEKAKSYFPIIERIFKEENLPTDFKYLALQESALQPDAVSTSNAVGFWQFKDFTALEMGLRVDKQVDERMNIVSATRAAAKYIKQNNTFFDNWLHALQAYQMGAGGAMRVLDNEAGSKSMTIDKKTYWYVKRYLAHKIAYEQATNGEPQLKLNEYTNTSGKTLKEIAADVKVSEEELLSYNKWLKRGRIPDDKAYTVIIPSDKYIALGNDRRIASKNQSKSHKEPEISSVITYNVADINLFPKIEKEQGKFARINGLPGLIASKGDKVTALATSANIPISKFLKYNEIRIDHRVNEGEIFYLKKKRGKAQTYYHVAQEDEALWEIAQKYGLRLAKLKVKNRMKPEESDVKPGRILWLRYVRPASEPIAYEEVSPAPLPIKEKKPELVRFTNPELKPPLQDSVVLRLYPLPEPREKVISRSAEKTLSVPSSEVKGNEFKLDSIRRTHTVQPGETFYAISKLYNASVVDVLEWNDLKINDKLAIGQKLLVYEYAPRKQDNTSKVIENAPYIYHTVQPGDTMYKIARSYEITVEDLMKLNDKSDFNLNLGEKIKVGKKTFSE